MTIHDDVVYGRAALSRREPWITPRSLKVIEGLVQPDWRVFEFGAGGSTCYWVKKCAHVISIEHNSTWVSRVTEMLAKDGLTDRVDLRYIPGLMPETMKDRFRPYADEILKEPDESFDLVFVDGEASSRGWCLANALSKVKRGGILLLDNSDWYKDVPNDGWTREDHIERGLKWIGQPGTFDWWTSIFTKQP